MAAEAGLCFWQSIHQINRRTPTCTLAFRVSAWRLFHRSAKFLASSEGAVAAFVAPDLDPISLTSLRGVQIP